MTGLSLAGSMTQAATVEVVTHQDRTLSGVVDARTDDRDLWLRRDEANLSLAVSVAWRQVARVAVDGEPVALEDALQRLPTMAGERRALSVLLGPVSREQATPILAGAGGPLHAAPRIASVAIDARLKNWDTDPQADGIELIVAAIDHGGVAWPVGGSLTVRLMGERQATRHRFRAAELHRWHEPVDPSDFGRSDGAARYRLPFRALDPESNPLVGAEAVVYATLGVHGQGNFAASAPVWLRRVSPLRDRLQLSTGSRRFPIERRAAARRGAERYVAPPSLLP